MNLAAAGGARVAPRWFAVAGFTWLACGALYLTLPPSPDQFEHSYIGWRLLEGAVPYRDFIDPNWPGVMWMHALSVALFGNQLWSWRALDFIALAASAFFLRDLVARSAGDTAAGLSLVIYPLFYVGLGQWFPGQHDTTAGQLLLPALWCHVRAYESQAWRWQIGTGIFLAAAMLSKPTVGVLGPLLMGHALLLGMRLRQVLLHAGVAAAAGAASLLLALLALLAQGATLAEVVDATYTYNVWTQFLEPSSAAELARSWFRLHVRIWHVLSLLAVVGAGWLLWRGQGRIATSALHLLWLAGVLSFLIQQRGFMYHLGPCYMSIAGLAAVALGQCLDRDRADGSRSWTSILGALLLLIVVAAGVRKLHDAYGKLPAALLQDDYALHLTAFLELDGLNVAQAVALARQIERDVPAGETVLVLGRASSMNFLARRAQPTRFYYAPVLINSRPPLPMADRWIDLFESDLRRTPPRWCLISTGIGKQWLEGDSRGAEALRELLSRHYQKTRPIKSADGREIYEFHERLR